MRDNLTERPIYTAGKDELLPVFDGNAISLLFGCNERYLPHYLAVVASIMEHASPDDRYDFWVVQSGIPESMMVTARHWIGRWPRASLRFAEVGHLLDGVNAEFPSTGGIPVAAYYRIFAPQIFARYDKMLYLDGDIVVLDNIAKLFNADLGGAAVGACHDLVMETASIDNPPVASYWRTRLRLEPGGPYFNAGVILMDLRRMRLDNLQAAILEKVHALVDGGLMDQDMLNSALKGNVEYFDLRWNFFDSFMDKEPRVASFRKIHRLHADKFVDARLNPGILHFVHHKPWRADYLGANAALYWRYAPMTPFYDGLRREILRDCSLLPVFGKGVLWSLQSANNHLRLLLSGKEGKGKYSERIYNLKMRKRNTLAHMRAMRFLPG